MVIDGNVVGIIEIIKKLDYVESLESCQGHLKTYLKQYDQHADPGHVFIFRGSLLLNVKNTKKAEKFFDCLNQIASKYDFAEFGEHKYLEPNCDITHSFKLRIYDLVKDNPPPDEGKEGSELVHEYNKFNYQVPYEAGLRRIIKFDKAWLELYQTLRNHLT